MNNSLILKLHPFGSCFGGRVTVSICTPAMLISFCCMLLTMKLDIMAELILFLHVQF